MPLHGKNGNVKNGTNAVADIDNWKLDTERDEKEISAFGDAALPYKSWLMGLIGCSGSLAGRLNMGDTNGQLAMWQSMTSDTALTLHLITTTGHEFQVSAFIKKHGADVKLNDTENVSFDFRVTGAASYS